MAEILSLKIISDGRYETFDMKPKKNSVEFSNHSFKSENKPHPLEKKLSRASFTSPVFLKYENISYSVSQGRKKEKKIILDDLSGKINIGELTGILGPSGSGKTSLMNILSGYKNFVSTRKKSITGRILVNGEDRDVKLFRKISSFVMQKDYLFEHFTVKETMMFASHLKLGDKSSRDEKQIVVNEILQNLSLLDCENIRVVNISGGERRRLCIALELLSDPLIMFLDEPTSGLDSAASNQCITLLKSLASSGRTIVASIHQPSSRVLENFDKLIFLANGQCVFEGMAHNLPPFLSSLNFHCPTNHNPADFVLHIVSQNKGKYIPILAKEAKNGTFKDRERNNSTSSRIISMDFNKSNEIFLKEYEQDLNDNEYKASNWTQFRFLFSRAMINTYRDKWAAEIRLILHVIIGILMGLLYFGIGNDGYKVIQNTVALHFSQVFILLVSVMIMVIKLPMERPIILRERLNDWYSLRNYYFAQIIADLPFQIVCTIIFATIFYWMSSQPSELFRYFYFIAFSVLTAVTSIAYGGMIGSGTSIEIGVCLATVVAMFIVGFSGIFIRFNAMPSYLRWSASASFIASAFEGIVITIYGYGRQPLDCKEDLPCYFSSSKLLMEEIGITYTDVHLDFILMIVSFLIFRIITYFVLCWKLRV